MRFFLRFLGILFLLFFCFGGLVYRILDLSYFSQAYYRKFVDSARENRQILKSIRGQIRDRNGFVLAMTTTRIDLGVDPYVVDIQKDREKIIRLATLLGKDFEEIEQYFRRESFIRNNEEKRLRWKRIAIIEDIGLYAKIKELKIKGIYGNMIGERIYPNNELACHVLGYVNKEGVAVSGIEHYMDRFLCGQDGWIESEKDGKQKEVALFRKTVIEPKNGANIELTLDLSIQETVECVLRQTMAKLCVKSGTVIISNPGTGEILALCNMPGFNGNEYNKVDVGYLRNRAITDVYEPGSTAKNIPFSIALQEGLITLQQRFDCTQETFSYHGRLYKLPKDHRPFGVLSAVDVLRKSSNRGAAQIGIILGAEKLYQAERAFGFGVKTDYGFDGEVSGLLTEPKYWDDLTITRMPMGHAVAVTPLQTHQAMGVFASGGYLLRPKVIARIFDENDEIIMETEPYIVRRVLTFDTVKKVREILHNPESPKATIGKVKLAHKTGTSQKIINGIYSHEHHIASCSGFFPVDEPRFLITVVLDDPVMEGTAYGSLAAYPTFLEIAKILIASYGLQ